MSVAPAPEPCRHCGGEIKRPDGYRLSNASFAARLYCSPRCGVIGGWNKRRGLPLDTPPGAPVARRCLIRQRAVPGEQDAIAAFIAERGVTRCPAKFVLPTQGALAPSDARKRLAAMPLDPNERRPAERLSDWYRRVGGIAAGKVPTRNLGEAAD